MPCLRKRCCNCCCLVSAGISSLVALLCSSCLGWFSTTEEMSNWGQLKDFILCTLAGLWQNPQPLLPLAPSELSPRARLMSLLTRRDLWAYRTGESAHDTPARAVDVDTNTPYPGKRDPDAAMTRDAK